MTTAQLLSQVRCVLLFVLVALVMPASAGAFDLPTDQPQQSRRVLDSLQVARQFWHTAIPCVRVYAVSDEMMTRMTGLRAVGGTAGPPCSIYLPAKQLRWNDYTSRVLTCNVIVHEVGHLFGHLHDADGRSVMFPVQYVDPVVYGCFDRFVAQSKANLRDWHQTGRGPQFLQRPVRSAG